MSSDRASRGTRIRIGRRGALAASVSLAMFTQASGCGTQAPAGSSTGAKPAAVTSNTAYVRLERGAHPLARPEYDQGPLDPNRRISNLSVVFKPTPQQMRDRNALRDSLTDPTSPNYHQWLTTKQYAARFGANADDIARTSAWLTQQGLQVERTSPLGARVTFSGRVADLQTAFHAEMRQYKFRDELHYAMSTAPSVPADLAGVVLGIHNTHDFRARPTLQVSKQPRPQTIEKSKEGLAPPDWAAIYDVAKLYTTGVTGTPITGAGVNIAILGVAAIAQSDIDAFRSTFGLAQKDFTSIVVPGTGAGNAASGGAGVEAVLDVEWSNGIAQAAHVDYFNTGADDNGDVDAAAYYAIEDNIDSIMSESFGICEAFFPASDQDLWDVFGSAANLLGITFLASSGDSGAAGCVDYGQAGLWTSQPSNFPGVTGVGGTEFATGTIAYGAGNIATGYSTSEQVWRELDGTSYIGGGGGISNVYSRPSYQSLIPTCTSTGTLPTNVTPSSMRQVPDVALSAGSILNNNPYWIDCTMVNSDCSPAGGNPGIIGLAGTSASTPSFAGVVALISQATGGARLGNINPMLYTLAGTTAFHDIALGSNLIGCKSGTDVGCAASNTYGYAAVGGYDCATGLGSVDAFNLVSAWAALTPTTVGIDAAPTAVSAGTSVNLTATVGLGLGASDSHVIAGSVTFTFQSYNPDGSPDLSWTLDTKAITGGTTTAGTASLSTVVPEGFATAAATEPVDVVAMYGGDAYHLASTSAKKRLTFTADNFCVSPSIASVVSGGTAAFQVVGGSTPLRWVIDPDYDGSCDSSGNNCSSVDATGKFKAGAGSGYVTVLVFDQYNAYSASYVAVGFPTTPLDFGDAGPPAACGANIIDAGAPPPDASGTGDDSGMPPVGDDDSGTTPVADASTGPTGPTGPSDASTGDASAASDAGSPVSSSSSGCSCTTAKRSESPTGMMSALALGLGLVARRRRSRKK
jgi:MYXO-CTERM domain-containing protein